MGKGLLVWDKGLLQYRHVVAVGKHYLMLASNPGMVWTRSGVLGCMGKHPGILQSDLRIQSLTNNPCCKFLIQLKINVRWQKVTYIWWISVSISKYVSLPHLRIPHIAYIVSNSENPWPNSRLRASLAVTLNSTVDPIHHNCVPPVVSEKTWLGFVVLAALIYSRKYEIYVVYLA